MDSESRTSSFNTGQHRHYTIPINQRRAQSGVEGTERNVAGKKEHPRGEVEADSDDQQSEYTFLTRPCCQHLPMMSTMILLKMSSCKNTELCFVSSSSFSSSRLNVHCGIIKAMLATSNTYKYIKLQAEINGSNSANSAITKVLATPRFVATNIAKYCSNLSFLPVLINPIMTSLVLIVDFPAPDLQMCWFHTL